ncbi:hypothetical protein [uncultured Thiodictyon sp.]|uniref:hypothetical protein n=1 Tax=uncultured Thiodictyon sp. TaxID=1846217 RepID=UPI0025E6CE1D|nr:hypothetical protein [uncultured Thiodictyon sp.]
MNFLSVQGKILLDFVFPDGATTSVAAPGAHQAGDIDAAFLQGLGGPARDRLGKLIIDKAEGVDHG